MNISNKFSIINENIKSLNAYCENGMVFVQVVLNAGFNGSISIANLTDLDFAPRIETNGIYSCLSTYGDKSKYVGSSFKINGAMYIWFDAALSNTEMITFVYPKKFS